jgi:hypothetical protein
VSNDLVAYSRAGDVFHYRWAARRCLRLIYPNTSLRSIVIEGSNEEEKAGEYVIDVTEYTDIAGNKKKTDYYQLKHTTVQQSEPFTLSDLRKTFTGFAKRFLQHKDKNPSDIANISFTIITNRKIADTLKQNFSSIIKKDKVDDSFKSNIEQYTNLTSENLALFCNTILFEDGEGNYNIQKDELRIELAQLLAGTIDNGQVDSLIALVQGKILTKKTTRIINKLKNLRRESRSLLSLLN